jgi:hypothetical protein
VVGVRLTAVSEHRAALEATGWCGVNLDGAVSVAYLDPNAAALVADFIAEAPLDDSFDAPSAEVPVARKVLEEWSNLRTLSDTPSSMVRGEALLGAFSSDPPEDQVADIEREKVR